MSSPKIRSVSGYSGIEIQLYAVYLNTQITDYCTESIEYNSVPLEPGPPKHRVWYLDFSTRVLSDSSPQGGIVCRQHTAFQDTSSAHASKYTPLYTEYRAYTYVVPSVAKDTSCSNHSMFQDTEGINCRQYTIPQRALGTECRVYSIFQCMQDINRKKYSVFQGAFISRTERHSVLES